MAGSTFARSESLLAQLSREVSGLRSRATQVVADLRRCHHPGLSLRLQNEYQALAARRECLAQLCRQLRRDRFWRDSLSLALLEELCRRPLVVA